MLTTPPIRCGEKPLAKQMRGVIRFEFSGKTCHLGEVNEISPNSNIGTMQILISRRLVLTGVLFLHVIGSGLITTANAQEPHTTHAKHPANRLADETSPYLLQHAYNPVQWYPWGEEALTKAKNESKPIFLSIGYSSCHWCHVMERESFMDDEIAKFMNENFVCIKVDREERPDVDSIYMIAVQIINRSGGWPLSAFLTSDANPFFGGTYFPARDNDRPGTVGFLTVMKKVSETWKKENDKVIQTGDQIAAILKDHFAGSPAALPIKLDTGLLDRMQSQLANDFDNEWGGFGFSPTNAQIPKFPTASNLFFLMSRAKTGNEQASDMLRKTLDRMAMGGMWDHIGGGFHRYSTDRYWHIPHFEKMLYDNGQLASVYAAAAEHYKNDDYARVVDRLAKYIAREMTDKSGGFYAALDADSEGEEGAFYRWTEPQLVAVLGQKDAGRLQKIFTKGGEPNFEDKFLVPLRTANWKAIAEQEKMSVAELIAEFQPIFDKLLANRDQRERPLTDTKILTGWNGLMIQGLADAGRILKRDEYTNMAASAAEFLLANSRDETGRLKRTYTKGKARLNAYLDDYAFLTAGLLALHRATGEEKWLKFSLELVQTQEKLFGDETNGGYFFTSSDHEKLIVRGKLLTDNARPTGSAVAAENLIYLAKATGDNKYRQSAIRTIQSSAEILAKQPISATRMGHAIEMLLSSEK